MIEITQNELNNLISQHEDWLRNGEIGRRPSFSDLNLSGLELKRANLYHSDFKRSNLTGCNFRYSNLSKADFSSANLSKANLKETNLFHANLYKSALNGVKVNEYTMFYFQLCPEEGEFIGYKKVCTAGAKPAIAKLLIPESARRNSATTYRCRSDKAKVLEITVENNQKIDCARSRRNPNFSYKVGELLEVSEFDEDRWHETASGIHFYLSRDLALLY